ncbi:RNA polymerase II, putative [Leishmania panamensis]|uniref:RNA uridylyltransferase n=1 Tax=Leishmania panamensis TaxID=5679 RepID=A0A088RQN9_LEIPA|nr:RNA polymerase II, putative [Leishmania panamensis]AIN98283.1 RNA polymerase II, putative [Leishmania panamensis]
MCFFMLIPTHSRTNAILDINMSPTIAELSGRILSQQRYSQILEQGKWLLGLLKGVSFDIGAKEGMRCVSPVVLPYGSIVSGTSLRDGDADYIVSFPLALESTCQSIACVIERERQEKLLSDIFVHIRKNNRDDELYPQRIFRARVPIVQYVRKSACEISKFDICLSLGGLKNSLLLRQYMAGDPRLRLGVLGAKQWGRDHQILNTRRGWISPYALSIMYIHFMKSTGRTTFAFDEEAVSQRVNEIISTAAESEGDISQVDELASVLPLQDADISLVQKDVFDFFAFYSTPGGFDFDASVVDIRSRERFSSKDQWCESLHELDEKERWQLLGHEVILLRDPFEPHSLGRSVDFFRGEEIREKFRSASVKKEPLSFFASL